MELIGHSIPDKSLFVSTGGDSDNRMIKHLTQRNHIFRIISKIQLTAGLPKVLQNIFNWDTSRWYSMNSHEVSTGSIWHRTDVHSNSKRMWLQGPEKLLKVVQAEQNVSSLSTFSPELITLYYFDRIHQESC